MEVYGVLALVKLGVRDVDVMVRGDSISALSWMSQGTIKGQAAINAAVVLTAICVKFGIRTIYSAFLSGLDNFKSDNFSRMIEKGWSVQHVLELNHMSPDCPIFDLRRKIRVLICSSECVTPG